MAKIVIVGGGISGLSAALFAKLKQPKCSVILVEASNRLGGCIKSDKFIGGSVHEWGPRTVRMKSPTVKYLLDVIQNINLSDQLISIDKKNKTFNKRYVYTHNELNLLDLSLLKLAQKPFKESFFTKFIKAAFRINKPVGEFHDLSMDEFVKTRFDKEVADYLANPIIRGIYACDSKNISIKSTFPNLLEIEKIGPNIVIGSIRYYLKKLLKSPKKELPEIKCEILKNYLQNSLLLSFYGGMETLIKGLSNHLSSINVAINLNSKVLSVRKTNKETFNLEFSDQTSLDCSQVILAVPSFVSSSLIDSIIPNSALLNNIHWNTVVVVVLEYRGRCIPYSGFGHLIPSWERGDTLGVIYDSCILPENDCRSETTTRYTVMLGGAWFYPDIARMNNDELLQYACAVIKRQLGVDGELVRFTVAHQNRCIPEYGMNHHDIVRALRSSIDQEELSIRLCGSSYDGVSVSDCVYSAYKAVHSLPDVFPGTRL